jgi:phage anti-repressor protein
MPGPEFNPNREQIVEALRLAKFLGYGDDEAYWQDKLNELDAAYSTVSRINATVKSTMEELKEQALIEGKEEHSTSKYVTLGDIAKELRIMQEQGMTREGILYALDRVYPKEMNL